MGHINYGHGMFDLKGLLSSPSLSGNNETLAANWSVCSLPLTEVEISTAGAVLKPASQPPAEGVPRLPALLGAQFQVSADTVTGKPPSTFLNVGAWGKGAAWINGNALGRYWISKGPQNALYVPESFLVPGNNELVILELESLPASAAAGNAYLGLSVEFTDEPDFRGPSSCNPASAAPAVGSNVVMFKCSSGFKEQ